MGLVARLAEWPRHRLLVAALKLCPTQARGPMVMVPDSSPGIPPASSFGASSVFVHSHLGKTHRDFLGGLRNISFCDKYFHREWSQSLHVGAISAKRAFSIFLIPAFHQDFNCCRCRAPCFQEVQRFHMTG